MQRGRFRVNSPTVVSETVDGEVVMIHLDTGNYYSLRSTGAVIWDAIERGCSLDAIAAALDASRRNGSAAGAVLGPFVAELAEEQLIVPCPADAGDPVPIDLPTGDLEPPVLEKYTDMQHLILLDPVHEVDDGEGWPRPRNDA
ncbi:MAG TPA: PqqD family peptide modification chaperone [Acidimicrobiia bacterium]|nr:PqqD family peptide modification chaperone [Acidimicrobiia bacterium]